jgi:tRNA nucleotidyltransferase (CCA-adding enzyme)
MQEVTAKVLKKIKPSAAEVKKFEKVTADFLKKLNSKLKDAKAILGGSGEKGTWLSGNHDIDIFVQYNHTKFKDAQLSDLLEPVVNKLFPKVKRVHGSRDYFQTRYKDYDFEIVPILKITQSKQAVNITDISPLHASWVKKNSKKITDEIRLTKAFAKANYLYGAESFINGFSGYVLEILTTYYGSFEELIKRSVSWENKDIFDIERFYKKHMIFREINKSKLQSPLIVIDPVDKSRNAAAALSLEKFFLFKKKAAEFLENPSESFFVKEVLTFSKLEKDTMYNLVYLEVSNPAGKEDVIGAKLMKAFEFLKKELTPFEIEDSGWQWNRKNKAVFFFVVRTLYIDSFEIRKGPPVKMEDAVKEFRKKNKEAYIDGRRWMVKIPRKNNKLDQFVKAAVKDEYFKERIKEVKKIQFG